MPCRDYRDDYQIIDRTETYKAMRDQLARIACTACRNLEKLGFTDFDPETLAWWTQHKRDDLVAAVAKQKQDKEQAERVRRERARKREEELNLLKKLQAKYGKNPS